MDVKRVLKSSHEFYEILSIAKEWWDFWKFPMPPIETLPTNMLCAYNDSGPVSIGFLYSSDSSISWLEWVVANPKSEKKDRALAIDLVLSSSKLLASALGFGVVFTSAKNESLIKKLSNKFKKSDECMTHFIWRA